MSEDKNSNSGGAAAHAGIGYQDRVAAWMCVQILAEQEASPLWGWPADSTLEFIRCETEQPVDDAMVGTSHRGLAFINAKHSVIASRSEDSDFASALSQFVRQFLASTNQSKGSRPWERPLDTKLDRFVLATSSESSAPVKDDLPVVLDRIRSLLSWQGLDDAAKTQPEREVLAKVKSHLQRFWHTHSGTRPTEQEIIKLLCLIRIQVLDVHAEGSQEREAKAILRTSVLQNPEQADTAWNTLIQTCALWASQRNGGAREDLQQVLLQAGIVLNAPRSYREDIERLKDHSQRTFTLLRPLSLIEMNGKEIKIRRPVSQALCEAAEQHSIVVVGEPGAGKSGVLHDLVEQLKETRDVVFLAVDRQDAHGLKGLRHELGLDHDVCKVLQNWQGTQPGFLVIDALDAARSPATAQTFYDLMALMQTEAPRWRVIASIRQYDLRHNTNLRPLFKGQPPSQFRSGEFLSLCHLNVRELGPEEWLQITSQSPELSRLFVAADAKLQELLLVPFNVKLMADLLGRGIAVERLTPIRTQIELLDLYWKERVAQPLSEKDAREILLSRAVNEMVSGRSLRVSRRQVATAPTDSPVLKDILSANILSEWQPHFGGMVNQSVLTFAHHVLFDYAVARLLLRNIIQPVRLLEDDPELIIAIRPSLVMHFEHVRSQDLSQFWELVFSFTGSQTIPEIGKLIGPSVAMESATEIGDFSLLIQALTSTDLSRRECAEKAFRHVTGALTVKAVSAPQSIVGDAALNWGELLNLCTAEPRATTVYSSRPVLHLLCDNPERLTETQRQFAGTVARRLLDYALTQPNRDTGLVTSGLETVCRTYESNPEASGAILRRCLERDHILQYGHEELFRLANEVERLVSIDPAVVEEIYRAAFTLMDDSEEKTDMGISRVLAMTSTRRQDFQMARYKLASEYNKFLNQSPIHALRSLIAAIGAYPKDRYSYWYAETDDEVSFDFNGRQAHLKADRSEVWDDGGGYGNHEEPLQMLNKFRHYLEQIGNDEAKAVERKQLIDLIVEENHAAAFWRTLLKAATKHPQTLGLEIRSLCWTLPILTGDDTSQPAGELLKAIFHFLTNEERQQVETTILSISELAEEEELKYAERRRNRLLGCLDLEAIVTSEARDILSELRNLDGVPPNEPRFHPPVVTWGGAPTDAENLRERGVPVEAEPNQQIISLMQPVKTFAGSFANERPSLAKVQEIIPTLQTLHTALLKAEAEGSHQHTRDLAWGYLADACESVAKNDEFNCELAEAGFIKSTLLEAAKYPDPHPEENYQSFDKHPSWGSPAARIDAAEGIMHLAGEPSCLDKELIEAIEKLSNDPVPPVRFQIASRLVALYRTAPELMWSLLERFSREENSRGVLQFLVAHSLNQLAGHHATQVAELVRVIFDRVREGAGADEVQKHCARILAGLYIWQDQPLCRETVEMIANDPAGYNTEAHEIVFNLRSWLNLGPVDPPNAEQDEVRSKSFDLLHHILSSVLRQTKELQAKYPSVPFSSWSEADQEKGRCLAHLADSVCMQIYFASGAYQDNNGEEKVPCGVLERKRFWIQSRSILELLSEFGYPSLTHYLLETLEYLITFEPDAVFLLIGRVVGKGREGGYQYESLAIDLIVRMVERFIAEYRHHLQENEACRRVLIEILDTFVEAGWPAARRLTYRMEEIFR
ncbi:MAG: hypothetical protein JNK38_21720 [Acidobacteria bacterium]|nr:hypothetical protein [Acidobacteriota bacterium]